MSVIQHAHVDVTTTQTTNSATYVDVPGASLSSSNFITGKKYLIVVTGAFQINSSAEDCAMICLHGSTVFAESEYVYEPNASTSWQHYGFMKVWTAVGGEGIKVQFRRTGAAGTVSAERIVIFAMNLSDDISEGIDWFYDEETATSAQLSTTPIDGGLVTFTPPTGSDWLVLSYAQHNTEDLLESHISRINSAGTFASSLPRKQVEAEDPTNDLMQFFLARVYTGLGAVSQTFKEQSLTTGVVAAGDVRLYSAVFALNLNKFRNRLATYTESDLDLGDGSPFVTNIKTGVLTADVQGPVWSLGWWAYDMDGTADPASSRLQLDDVDAPGGQTSGDRRTDAWDARDEQSMIHQSVDDVTAGAHTYDLDGSVSVAAVGRSANYRTLMAITMEFPPVPPFLKIEFRSAV